MAHPSVFAAGSHNAATFVVAMCFVATLAAAVSVQDTQQDTLTARLPASVINDMEGALRNSELELDAELGSQSESMMEMKNLMEQQSMAFHEWMATAERRCARGEMHTPGSLAGKTGCETDGPGGNARQCGGALAASCHPTALKGPMMSPQDVPLSSERLDFAFDTAYDNDDDDWTVYLFDDFEDGANVWSNSHVTACGGVTVLGGYWSRAGPQGEVWTHVTRLPRHTHVRIKAEVFFVDDWEREFVYLKIDDRAVWSRDCLQCGKKGRNFCGNHRYQDTLGQNLDVTVPHKNEIIRLTFGSSSRAPTSIKSWGLTNLMIYLSEKDCQEQLQNKHGGTYQLPYQEDDPDVPLGRMCGNDQWRWGAWWWRAHIVKIYAAGGGGGCCCRKECPGLHCYHCHQIGCNRGDGLYWINMDTMGSGGAFEAYCDMSTDGGGWTLFGSFFHRGVSEIPPGEPNPENKARVAGVPTAPADKDKGYAGKSIKEMFGMPDQYSEVRFFCETEAHSRIVHFKTINEDIRMAAWDADQTRWKVESWKDPREWAALPGHSGNLPAATGSAGAQKGGGFYEYPFQASGAFAWAVRGGGSAFDCDSAIGGPTMHTNHNVMIR